MAESALGNHRASKILQLAVCQQAAAGGVHSIVHDEVDCAYTPLPPLIPPGDSSHHQTWRLFQPQAVKAPT